MPVSLCPSCHPWVPNEGAYKIIWGGRSLIGKDFKGLQSAKWKRYFRPHFCQECEASASLSESGSWMELTTKRPREWSGIIQKNDELIELRQLDAAAAGIVLRTSHLDEI